MQPLGATRVRIAFVPVTGPSAAGPDEFRSLIEELRSTVERRRRDNVYAPDLERRLDEHLRNLVAFHPVDLVRVLE